MTQIIKSAEPKTFRKDVTLPSYIVRTVHNTFYGYANNTYYGKKDGLNGYRSAKRALRYCSSLKTIS